MVGLSGKAEMPSHAKDVKGEEEERLEIGYGSACLQYQHLGVENRKIKSSRPASST